MVTFHVEEVQLTPKFWTIQNHSVSYSIKYSMAKFAPQMKIACTEVRQQENYKTLFLPHLEMSDHENVPKLWCTFTVSS